MPVSPCPGNEIRANHAGARGGHAFPHWVIAAAILFGCSTDASTAVLTATPSVPSVAPSIQLNGTQAGDGTIQGSAANVDGRTTKVVLWALTSMFYIQPTIVDRTRPSAATAPGKAPPIPGRESSPSSSTRRPTCPDQLDCTIRPMTPEVLAWTEYPNVRPDDPISFSGYSWGIKVALTPFGPGPNVFSDSRQMCGPIRPDCT